MFTICREKYIGGLGAHYEKYLELVLNDTNKMVKYDYGVNWIAIFCDNEDRFEDEFLYTTYGREINVYKKAQYISNDEWKTCGTDYKLFYSVSLENSSNIPKFLAKWDLLGRPAIENDSKSNVDEKYIEDIEEIIAELPKKYVPQGWN